MKKINKFLIGSLLLFGSFSLVGCKNNKPRIGDNGDWYVGDDDLGVPAQGPQGEKGKDGVSIVKIEKTSSANYVDTYTITFSDGKTTNFTVTNGEDGDDLTIESVSKTKTEGLVDTYTIVFSNGKNTNFAITNGKNGEIVTISSINKTKTEGLIDTYTISYTDGKSLSFTVTNGKDGLTPYVGENGNWWIGNEDTGYFAGYLVNDSELTPESSGLMFVNAVVNGKAGLVVDSWDDDMIDPEITEAIENETRSCDIVIPNYVGATPVIGIADSVFAGVDYISSIKLSKNTVYLGNNVFKNCDNLSSVDFNGCKLTAIPDYCFYGTNIKEIDLPDTVTKLGDYAFGNIYFNEFDYSNITYFGNYSLQYLMTPYVFLSKDVKYVGDKAFASTYVFTEYDSIPDNWGDNIAGIEDLNDTIVTGCINSDEYIYTLYNDGISLHAYKGKEKWLEIPEVIDGYTVKQIGYGFDSLTESYVEYLASYYEYYLSLDSEEEALFKIKNMEGIIIPDTVTSIEYGALLNYGAFIYIPESVNTMWGGVGICLDDTDVFGSMIAFESTSLPTFKSKWLATSNSCSPEDYLSEDYLCFVATGIDYSKVSYDSEKQMVFYKESMGYSLLACLDYESKNIIIPSTYNNSNVYTIRKAAVKCNFRVQLITIEDGIAKIQGYAFFRIETDAIAYIPSSVTVINAYGFNDGFDIFYASADSKPTEWDSYWAGDNTGNIPVIYGEKSPLYLYDNFLYTISNDKKIELRLFLGDYDPNVEIRIPSKIAGKTVSSIASNFISANYRCIGVKIYIPSTIASVGYHAFTYNTSNNITYYPSFYLESESIPSGWDDEWDFDNYSRTNSNKYIYYGQSI